jgi:hypothetical protein
MVSMAEVRNAHRILFEAYKGKRQFESCRREWEYNFEKDLQGIRNEVKNYIYLAEDRDHQSVNCRELDNGPSGTIKLERLIS